MKNIVEAWEYVKSVQNEDNKLWDNESSFMSWSILQGCGSKSVFVKTDKGIGFWDNSNANVSYLDAAMKLTSIDRETVESRVKSGWELMDAISVPRGSSMCRATSVNNKCNKVVVSKERKEGKGKLSSRYEDKVKAIWNRVRYSKNNEFKSREEFEQWLEDNNFKSWKTVKRYDTSMGYSKDNCYVASANVSRESEYGSEEDKASTILIETSCKLEDMIGCINYIETSVNKLESSSVETTMKYKAVKRHIDGMSKHLKEIIEEIEGVEII